MGLDMYLHKEYYVKNWEHYSSEERHTITILKGGKPATIATERICYVTTEEMYWRKANAIHKWFVDNVQDGKDDCGTYDVEREQLQALLDLVNKVLAASELVPARIQNGSTYKNGREVAIMEDGKRIKDSSVAQELLPTTSGFFFGGTAYDQYYYEDLQDTKEGLERCLAEGDDGGTFQYHSSW